MINLNKTIWATYLFSFTTPLLALPIQCKNIVNTPTQQCTLQAGTGSAALYGFTNMPYALCSKALCQLKKKNATKASCKCSLYKSRGWSSLSISPTTYSTAKPVWNKQHQLISVQSNYSLANVATQPQPHLIGCQFKQPQAWADCFGVRCRVSGSAAYCLCPVSHNKAFSITGPGTTKKCSTKPNQAWSAILQNNGKNNSQIIVDFYKKFYPSAPIT